MPNINDAFPSNYIKASDLQGHEVVVTIKNVEFEDVGRDKEHKPVVYFVGKQKGFILNKTNARKITEITGSALTEEWQGHAVVIYPTETDFAGETVECLRIKAVNKSRMGRMTPTAPAPKPPMPEIQLHENHSEPVTLEDIPFMWLLAIVAPSLLALHTFLA